MKRYLFIRELHHNRTISVRFRALTERIVLEKKEVLSCIDAEGTMCVLCVVIL